MAVPFIAKLSFGCVLTESDRALLIELIKTSRRVPARTDIIGEGDSTEDIHVVAEGFACRYKMLADGKRHIMALLIPGDFCDPHVAIVGPLDHSIGAITACTMVEIPSTAIDDLAQTQPRINRALRWASLVDEAILREWLVSMGVRPAAERLAHLFCELLTRLGAVGLTEADAFDLPMTQQDLGEILGLSTVHINRSMQFLNGKGLISYGRRRLTVPDRLSLENFSGFDPTYLHLRKDNAPAP